MHVLSFLVLLFLAVGSSSQSLRRRQLLEGGGLRTSGRCENLILTEYNCVQRASELGVSNLEYGVTSSTKAKPPGCYYSKTSDKISVNTDADSAVECGNEGRDCICGARLVSTTTMAKNQATTTTGVGPVPASTTASSTTTKTAAAVTTTTTGAPAITTSSTPTSTSTTTASPTSTAASTTSTSPAIATTTSKAAVTTTTTGAPPITTSSTTTSTSTTTASPTSTSPALATTTTKAEVQTTTEATVPTATTTVVPTTTAAATTTPAPTPSPQTTQDDCNAIGEYYCDVPPASPKCVADCTFCNADFVVNGQSGVSGENKVCKEPSATSCVNIAAGPKYYCSSPSACLSDCLTCGTLTQGNSEVYVCEAPGGPGLDPFVPPSVGFPCGDHCTTHGTGQCTDGSDDEIPWGGQCQCSQPSVWGGVDCTRNLQVRYHSTIFMKAVVPVELEDSSDRAEVRSFVRAFKANAAEALGIEDDGERVEVMDESQVAQTVQGVTVNFMIHESMKFQYLTHDEEITTRNELVRLAQQAVDDTSGNLFKRSSRNLVALASTPIVNFSPSELNLVIDRKDSKKTELTGSIAVQNTAPKGDDLVVTMISIVDPGGSWLSLVGGFRNGGYSIAKRMQHSFRFTATEAHFNGMEPGVHTAAVEFTHNAVNGKHTVLINLEIKGDATPSGESAAEADEIPDDLEELVDSPRFIAGIASGGALVLLSFCFFFCMWTCVFKRCCGGRKANLERGGVGRFQRVGNADGGGDVEMSSATKTSSSGPTSNPLSNPGSKTENSFGISLGRNAANASNGPGNVSQSAIGMKQSTPSSGSSSPAVRQLPLLRFVDHPALEPEDYERKWQSMDTTKLWGTTLGRLPSESELEDLMLKDKVQCMASGSVEGVQKFYFYAEHRDPTGSHLFMIECSLTLATRRIAFVFKTSSEGKKDGKLYNEAFIEIVKKRLKYFHENI